MLERDRQSRRGALQTRKTKTKKKAEKKPDAEERQAEEEESVANEHHRLLSLFASARSFCLWQ